MTSRRARLGLPILFFILVVPAAASAQASAPRTKSRAPAAAAPSPAVVPAAAPARAPAPRAPEPTEDDTGGYVAPSGPPPAWFFEREWRVTPLLGLETGLGDSSYSSAKVRIDVETTLETIAPRATASFVLSVGALHAADEQTITMPAPAPGFPSPGVITMKWGANVFDLVPTARLTFAASPKVWFHGDGGLGLVYTVVTGVVDVPGLGRIAPVADGIAGVVRLGGGITLAPDPNLRFGAQLGLDLRFGDGLGSAFSLLVSASHRF